MTKSGKMSHIALCIVKHIHEKKQANAFIYKILGMGRELTRSDWSHKIRLVSSTFCSCHV